MRILITGDIHGSVDATKALLSVYEKRKAERMVILGDVLYHGPRNDLPESYRPKEVVRLLSGYKESILAVRGNCDAEVDQMVLPFPIMADYAVMFLEGLKGRMVYLTHGHVYGKADLPPIRKGDIVLYGHTHIPEIEVGDAVFINPGSPSLPKGGFPPTFLWYEDGRFTIETFDGKMMDRWEGDAV